MAGHKKSVATQILSVEPRALYTHCDGHSLNLAMYDTIKNCKLTRDAMDITNEVSKLVKFSPKRNAIFDNLKEELSPDTPGFRVLVQRAGQCVEKASKACGVIILCCKSSGSLC